MKVSLTHIIVLVLLIANIFAVTHVDCYNVDVVNNLHIMDTADTTDCDGCFCGHNHASLSFSENEIFSSKNSLKNDWTNTSYFSRPQSPPFQPPKA